MAISTYMPYGAYELKARYQFNLMAGLLITASTIALILVAAWVYALIPSEEPAVAVKPTKVVSVVDLPLEQITIIRPEVPTTNAREDTPVRVGIPEPCPDDEFINEDVVIASREELAVLINEDRPAIFEEDGKIVVDTEFEDKGSNPFEIEILEIYPEMIHRHVPEYPRLLKEAGIEGVVWIRVRLSEQGKVLKAIVHKSSGTDGLDEAAIEAAYKNVFKPGIQNGRPVKCWVSYKVVFELSR